ncbi:MAG: hypothetical protein ACJ72N_17070 [Labedaea sp.]
MADTAGMSATDLALTPRTIKDALELARRGDIDRSTVPHLLCMALHDPGAPLKLLAREVGLLVTTDDATMMVSIESALNSLGMTFDEFTRLPAKQRNKLRNRVLGRLRTSLPASNMANAARLLNDARRPDRGLS